MSYAKGGGGVKSGKASEKGLRLRRIATTRETNNTYLIDKVVDTWAKIAACSRRNKKEHRTEIGTTQSSLLPAKTSNDDKANKVEVEVPQSGREKECMMGGAPRGFVDVIIGLTPPPYCVPPLRIRETPFSYRPFLSQSHLH